MSSESRRSSSSDGTRESNAEQGGAAAGSQAERVRGPGGRQMLFTGPDYIRDHRVSVEPEHHYVGIGTMSPEGTSEVGYLWRAPTYQTHPTRPKSTCVGEIGWGVPNLADWSLPQSGAQIKLGPFRQAVEDRNTHLYQNPWCPGADGSNSSQNQLVTVENSNSGRGESRRGASERSGHTERAANQQQSSPDDRKMSTASTRTNNTNNSAYSTGPRRTSGYGYQQ